MRPYAERKAARIERLLARAERLRTESHAAYETSNRMASIIPFGQPILVGHHSEGRDRRYRDRIWNTMGKSVKLGKAADECDRRAASAESNEAISSDDPNAIDLLKEKLAGLERDQQRNREINATIRTAKRHAAKDGVPWEPVASKALEEMGVSPQDAASLTQKDFAGRIGIADYEFANKSANIRRVKDRILALERKVAAPPKAPEVFGDVRVEENENRVQIFFPDKPPAAVRTELKSHGFRWAPTEGAWQRMASSHAWYLARTVAKAFAEQKGTESK